MRMACRDDNFILWMKEKTFLDPQFLRAGLRYSGDPKDWVDQKANFVAELNLTFSESMNVKEGSARNYYED